MPENFALILFLSVFILLVYYVTRIGFAKRPIEEDSVTKPIRYVMGFIFMTLLFAFALSFLSLYKPGELVSGDIYAELVFRYVVNHLWVWGTAIPVAMLSSYILIRLNHKSEEEKNDGIKH